MRRLAFPLIALALTSGALAVGWGVGRWRQQPVAPLATTQEADQGPVVYQMYCASCHGPDGHGDGSAAATLRPPPRDFAARPWHFEPTREVIRQVALDGIPETGMPSFRAALTSAELDAVVAHVLRLATTGPIIEKALSEEEQILADAGFSTLLGTTPPPLTLCDVRGRKIKLADCAGKLVLVHFWGTNCSHCIKEMPALNELERQQSGRLKVLHVCTDEEDPQVAQQLLDRLVPGTITWIEANGLGLARYEVQSLPTTWIIAPNGRAIGCCHGAQDWKAKDHTRLLGRWLREAD